MRRLGLALAALALLACALPAAAAAVAPSSSKQLQLVFPLNADTSGLESLAKAVSTPGSPEYGQFEPIAALEQRFGAPSWARQRVLAYLKRGGATSVKIDATGLFAVATMRAGLAERLFATQLKTVRSASGEQFIAPASAATVPSPLHGLVTGVVGLDTQSPASPRSPRVTHAPRRLGARQASGQPTSAYSPATGTAAGCSAARSLGGFTPAQYLTAYNLQQLHNEGLRGGGERVALIEVDGFKLSDIKTFGTCFGISVPRIDAFGVGLKHPLSPGPESTLDLEVLTSAAPKLSGIDVYETTADAVGSLQAFAAPFENAGFKPQVISASLGLCEPSIQAALGSSGLRTAESEFEMAAAGGISVLGATGDSGSADCTNSNGAPYDSLAVNFPASSPWVTGVGGTNLALNANNTIADEVVWNDTDVAPGSAGGGGASILFARPSYQDGTAPGPTRSLPDVSMLADVAPGYAVYCTAGDCVAGGVPAWQPVGGTSASTPLLAGGVALVDQLLRERGRADVGQLNPLLYAIGRSADASGVFNDVTAFGNDVGPYISGNGEPLGCCTAGIGYDEASGWGSVNVAGLAAAAAVLEPRAATVKLSVPPHQRPVAARKLLANVSCSQGCSMAAFAEVTINHGKPFTVESKVNALKKAGHHVVTMTFSNTQENKLRAALGRHEPIQAYLYGVTLSSTRTIQRETGGALLTIRG